MNVHRLRRQGGVAAVELAIVLPVFVLLLMACGELGRAAYQHNALAKAVRDGAQYAAQVALIPATGVIDLSAGTVAQAKNLVVFGNPGGTGSPLLPGLTTGDVDVTEADATHVRVTATYAYLKIFAALPSIGHGSPGSPGTMTASVTARAL